MTTLAQQSEARLYRLMAVSLAVATVLLLIPAEWLAFRPPRERAWEPEPRPITFVRLQVAPTEPEPALQPPPPESEVEPEPAAEPPPEPEPPPPVEFEPVLDAPPEFEPLEREPVEPRPALRPAVEARPQLEPLLDEPEVTLAESSRAAVPPKRVPTPQPSKPAPRLRQATPLPDEPVAPRPVPRQPQQESLEVAKQTRASYHDATAEDVGVVTDRPTARRAPAAATAPVARNLRTGEAIRHSDDAPAVDLPRGNTARPAQKAPLVSGGAVSGSRVVYDAHPGDAAEVAVATPTPSSNPGQAPELAVTRGGSDRLAYSSAPGETAVGTVASGEKRATRGPTVDRVGAALSRRYGLPLIAAERLGRRSTDGPRWNLLLPEISDLLRRALRRGKPAGELPAGVVVQNDRPNLLIRYPDGVIHLLASTEDGLAAFFVANTSTKRDVSSRIDEAELARRTLLAYLRGSGP